MSKQQAPSGDGTQVFESYIEVAGTYYRKKEALGFARGKGHSIELVREPRNKHDPNAIKVMGYTRTLFGIKRWFLGYVPAEVSKRVIERGFWGRVAPNLRRVNVSDDQEFINIHFDLLGPKGLKKEYLGH